MRVASPSKDAVEIDGVTGRRYKSRNGMYDMHPADAAHIADIGGFIPGLNGVTSRSRGYRCVRCGFGCYFNVCGRCGGVAMRED
jgi:hypothetical protein